MIIQIKRNKESENSNILITAITVLLNSKTCSNTIHWVSVMCSISSHQAMSRKWLQIDLGKQSCPVTEWLTKKMLCYQKMLNVSPPLLKSGTCIHNAPNNNISVSRCLSLYLAIAIQLVNLV